MMSISRIFAVVPIFNGVSTSDKPRVSIYPDHFLLGAFQEKTSFGVDVNITNVEGLYSWEVHLNWNSTVMECANVTFDVPSFVFNYTHNMGTVSLPEGPPYNGHVVLGSYLLGCQTQTFNGNGTLCHVDFTVLTTAHVGCFPIEINECILLGIDRPVCTPVFIPKDYPTNCSVCFRLLVPPSYVVSVDPLDQVVSWHSEKNLVDFNVSLNGANYCNLTIPLAAINGAFTVITDMNLTKKNGYLLDYNATHAFLHFNYGFSAGLHEVTIIGSAWGDVNNDGKVDIIDITSIAKQFGKKLDTR